MITGNATMRIPRSFCKLYLSKPFTRALEPPTWISFSQTLSAPPTSHTITVQSRKATTVRERRPKHRALAGDPSYRNRVSETRGAVSAALEQCPISQKDTEISTGGNPSSGAGSGDSSSNRTTRASSLRWPEGLAWSHRPLRSTPSRLSLPGSRFPGHPPPARPTRPVTRQQSPAARPVKAGSRQAGRRPRSPGARDRSLTSRPATWRGGAGARPPPAPSMPPGCDCSGRAPGRHRTLTPSPPPPPRPQYPENEE